MSIKSRSAAKQRAIKAKIRQAAKSRSVNHERKQRRAVTAAKMIADHPQITFGTPIVRHTDLSKWTVWESECGQFQVVLSESLLTAPGDSPAERRFVAMHAVKGPNGKKQWRSTKYEGGPSHCKGYRSLEGAIAAIVEFASPSKESPVTSNAREIVAAAEPEGIAEVASVRPAVEQRQRKSAPKSDSAKAAKAKAPRESKGPGVISTIVECLQGASKKAPATKQTILAELVERFPDRPAKGLESTIGCQLPKRLIKEKGLAIKDNGNGGYWIQQ